MKFADLNLAVNIKEKDIEYNKVNIAVQQYLPIKDKFNIYKNVIDICVDENGFINPIKMDMIFYLEVIQHYTNLEFTEEDKSDLFLLYDLIETNGLLDTVLEAIPEVEFEELYTGCLEVCDYYGKSASSIVNILNNMSKQPATSMNQVQEFLNSIKDDESLKMVKDIATKY